MPPAPSLGSSTATTIRGRNSGAKPTNQASVSRGLLSIVGQASAECAIAAALAPPLVTPLAPVDPAVAPVVPDAPLRAPLVPVAPLGPVGPQTGVATCAVPVLPATATPGIWAAVPVP